MGKINEDMKTLLGSTIWVLGTADANGIPNAVPIHYAKVLNDSQLMLVNNFMKKTVANIEVNPQVTVSAWKDSTGYQFKGLAKIETAGANFDTALEMVKGKMTPQGAIIIDVDSIYLTTPGPNAGDKVE
ncbi:MAG: pyridoxamine 5'-phosphate oxidase family protein [Syntrophomonadaceae bacterium]|nr:pyridoxamine 5'-phosphate oxidase family protein [Syntrophomonadaceae bacterium]